jgi:nucleoside-triphosphatase THEP1
MRRRPGKAIADFMNTRRVPHRQGESAQFHPLQRYAFVARTYTISGDCFGRRTAMSKIVILTGERGAGKSTWILALCRYWKTVNRPFFGAAEMKVVENGEIAGIDAVDLVTEGRLALAVRDDEQGLRVGRWRFLEAGIAFANDCYLNAGGQGVAVIDEIGEMELRGGGLSVPWRALQEGRYPAALVVVRQKLLEKVQERLTGDARIIQFSDEVRRLIPEEMDLLISNHFNAVIEGELRP